MKRVITERERERRMTVPEHRERYVKLAPKVFEMREKGISERVVAETLDLKLVTVRQYYQRARRAVDRRLADTVEVRINQQNRRYERLLEQWLPIALSEDAIPFDERKVATDETLAILKEVNKLNRLGGYGDPTGGVTFNPTLIFQQLNQAFHLANGADVVDGSVAALEAGEDSST